MKVEKILIEAIHTHRETRLDVTSIQELLRDIYPESSINVYEQDNDSLSNLEQFALFSVEISLFHSFGDSEGGDLWQDIIATIRGRENAEAFVQAKREEWLSSWVDPSNVDSELFQYTIKRLNSEQVNIISYQESQPYPVLSG